MPKWSIATPKTPLLHSDGERGFVFCGPRQYILTKAVLSTVVFMLFLQFLSRPGNAEDLKESDYFGAYIVTVDGLSFSELIPFSPSSPRKDYLVRSIESLFPSVPKENIYNFWWPGDPVITDILVEQLGLVLTDYSNQARGEGKKLIVVSHSWGTVLSFLALTETYAHCDLFITLSTPIDHMGYPIPLCLEDVAVKAYTETWLSYFGCLNPNDCFVDLTRWANFYAWGDIVSGPLQPRVFSEPWITDEDVEGRGWLQETCLTRNAYSTWTWHAYTTLLEDYAVEYNCPGENPSNEPLRERVETLIKQNSASITINLPQLQALQEGEFSWTGWIGNREVIESAWDFDFSGDINDFNVQSEESAPSHRFRSVGKRKIGLRVSGLEDEPIIIWVQILSSPKKMSQRHFFKDKRK